ncbi:uncharacterized protein N7500_007318 [Penicillium coprophilum]|uniref:uncharacterized protein n=1 Tax=Penicillium coprophilum TaxID=36646 RepID=UPI00239D2CD8|nr:uncharacterized protein N7500_007318 [Penicillium coprophilum]KAJ5165488.1 hypothetical protein N7500_007318 [Penicillium coprophilum]
MSQKSPSKNILCSIIARRLDKLESSAHHAEEESELSPEHDEIRAEDAKAKRHKQNDWPPGSIGETSVVATPDESAHRATEAHQLIQQELEQNGHVTQDRMGVLHTALELVKQMSYQTSSSTHLDLETTITDEVTGSEPSPPELLYMMLPGMTGNEGDYKHLHWPDHISSSTLENMILCLVENGGDEHLRLHYRIYHSPAVIGRLEKSQRQYKAIALAALCRVHFLSPPSLSLVQALLSGAMLMQYIGNVSRSWSLTAFAARVLVSLNSHTVEARRLLRTELVEDFDLCLYWCYYLDKVLSALFARQPSLPKLYFDPVSLIPLDSANPLQKTVKVMVEMAKVQESILDMQISRAEKGAVDISQVDSLIQKADSLFTHIKETRLTMPEELQNEFDAAEFGYFAMMTSILKYSRPAYTSFSHHECLDFARKALSSLNSMLHPAGLDLDTVEPYPSFLSWTVLLYPLTPFFVLFCNVVSSSHYKDFGLMQDITRGLSRFVHANKWIHKVHSLFNMFLGLCGPLMQHVGSEKPWSIGHDGSVDNTLPHESLEHTDESLMWDLFTAQPSLEWFDLDLGDI